MAGLLHHATILSPPVPAVLPAPRQLAELGTVLCLYRPEDGGELGGWLQAVRAEASIGMDSDGPHESLSFYDARDRCCWRLYLLPDSDFLAWDTLSARLPACRDVAANGVAERLWRRLAGRLGGGHWRIGALRLHALPGAGTLASSQAPVSALGIAAAPRIARAEGAEGDIRYDDCCCARAAAARSTFSPAGGSEVPLVRL